MSTGHAGSPTGCPWQICQAETAGQPFHLPPSFAQDLIGDANPMVVANAVAALSEIQELSGKPVLELTQATVAKLLRALNECTEWGQVGREGSGPAVVATCAISGAAGTIVPCRQSGSRLHVFAVYPAAQELATCTRTNTYPLASSLTSMPQVFILDSVVNYTPGDARDAEGVIERVLPRLQHANAAVVLSAIKVIIKNMQVRG